jgi:hypothetical protein
MKVVSMTAFLTALCGSLFTLYFGVTTLEGFLSLQSLSAGSARAARFTISDLFPFAALALGILPTALMIGWGFYMWKKQMTPFWWNVAAWSLAVAYFAFALWYPFERFTLASQIARAALFLFPVGLAVWLVISARLRD